MSSMRFCRNWAIEGSNFLKILVILGLGFITETSFCSSAFGAVPVKPTHPITSHAKPVHKTVSSSSSSNNAAWVKRVNDSLAAGLAAYRQNKYSESEKITRSLLPELFKPGFTLGGRASVYQILGLSIMEKEGDPARLVKARRYLALSNDSGKSLSGDQYNRMRLSNRFAMASMDAMMGHQAQALSEYQAILNEPLAQDEQFKQQLAYAKQVMSALSTSDNTDNYLAQFPKPYIHWQNLISRPIKVYITSGSGMADWHAENPALVQKAYEEWRTQLPDAFKFEFVNQPELADTIISWTPNPILEADGVTQELGRCEMGYYGSTLQTANIVLALHNMTHEPVSSKGLYSVALHEIGHSLGLVKSHSNNPGDIMYKSTLLSKGSTGHLTQRDIATMRALYQQPAAYTNPDISLFAFRNYAQLTQTAGDAVSAHDTEKAVNLANEALAIYNQDAQAHYVLGIALYNRKSYQLALPELLKVVDMHATQSSHAYLLASSSLIALAQDDLRSRQYDRSTQHLQMAQEFMNSHPEIVLSSEQVPEQTRLQNALNESVIYAQQAKATEARGGIVVMGNPDDASSGVDANGAKKKKGWWGRFLEASAALSVNMPVRISAPSGSF